ncbi:MAG: hypothetical protein ABR501_05410 [Pyrinomonadaceae bacterium]
MSSIFLKSNVVDVGVSKRMNKILLKILVTLIVSLTFFIPCPAQNRTSKKAQPAQIQLVSRYKKNTLVDISADGKLLLLYGASTPKKTLKPGGVQEWQPKRDEKYFDLLRIVEWASGRELAALHLHIVPNVARFTGDVNQICFREENKNRLWNYVSGKVTPCDFEPEKAAYRGSSQKYASPDGKLLGETSKKQVREILFLRYVRGVVNVANAATGEKLGEVLHPTVNEPYDWPLTGYVYSVGFTPDNRHLVTSYEDDTYVWRLNLQIKK